jgi:protein-S-isoprenylcysteine O-methyltransferase Ste14
MKLKIIPPVYFCASLIFSIILHFTLPLVRLVEPPYSYAGILLMALGFALTSWARRLFEIKNMPVRPGEALTTLETSGPFRFSRNPMYLGLVMVLLGGAIGLGSLTAFVGPAAFWAVIRFLFIPFEERKLEETFGQKYLDYKKTVRRWL